MFAIPTSRFASSSLNLNQNDLTMILDEAFISNRYEFFYAISCSNFIKVAPEEVSLMAMDYASTETLITILQHAIVGLMLHEQNGALPTPTPLPHQYTILRELKGMSPHIQHYIAKNLDQTILAETLLGENHGQNT